MKTRNCNSKKTQNNNKKKEQNKNKATFISQHTCNVLIEIVVALTLVKKEWISFIVPSLKISIVI
jgi:hypothetical protein